MDADLYRKTVLPSGLTLLTERIPDRRSLALGVWVRNGARDEPGERLGISHFIEHMMFKGTERRDARAIAASLESLGGHLDAFTGREEVCYYARALAEHLPEVVDVLADIVCRSSFATAEVDREKSVVREEIASVEDNPEDKVTETLSEQVWPGHPLGRPILGTEETVGRLDSARLRAALHLPAFESRAIVFQGKLDPPRHCLMFYAPAPKSENRKSLALHICRVQNIMHRQSEEGSLRP